MAHWSGEKEKGGGIWQFRLVWLIYKYCGVKRLRVFLYPTVAVFFLLLPKVRRLSRRYFARLEAIDPDFRFQRGMVFRHLFSFSYSLIEKVAAWDGKMHINELRIMTEAVDELVQRLQQKKGAVIICSHLGNMEILRALASSKQTATLLPDFGIQSIVDFSGTSKFNRFLEEINPQSMVRLVSARNMGPDTIIGLQHAISKGDLVIIAADRTSAENQRKSQAIDFLGQRAWFPQGSFILASLLDAPLYFMFGLRLDEQDFDSAYGFYVWKSSQDLSGSRKDRMKKITIVIQEFVGYLEMLCKKFPTQWYNFFDFWQKPE